ncbi:MAG TPA: 3'-5' exonuclease, partial [Candidatus Woesebacteria bacterium]|nr:3'-5' exonuclease [Candidatus Woesebacteria bacterium]
QAHEFYDQKADKVTLLSIHAAKGLEFPYVFIIGFEEGIIPFIKKQSKPNIEEEKRLLYVAMTRAKNGLYVLQTQERNRQKTALSSFQPLLGLDVILDEAIEKRKKQIKKWKDKKSQMMLF